MTESAKAYLTLVFLSVLMLGSVLECLGAKLLSEETTIKSIEKAPLSRFKAKVYSQLTQDYQKHDLFLIKFLRAKELNVKEATKMILEMLKWRKEYGMDNILGEDFSDLIREFPFTMDAVDFEGRPVGTADIADFDARKVILTGRRDRAIRFVFRMSEIAMRKVMKAHADGFNISTGTVLANLDGFNTSIPIYRNLIIAFESYFPGLLHKLIGINTPMSFYPVFRLFVPLISKGTRDSVKLYGTDKKQWQEVILSMISAKQLQQQFGGILEKPDFN